MIRVSNFYNLNDCIISDKDLEIIVNKLSLDEKTFLEHDPKKINEIFDFREYTRKDITYYGYVYNTKNMSNLEKFIVDKANSMRTTKSPSEKYLMGLLGKNSANIDDPKAQKSESQCLLNLVYIDLSNKKVQGWLYGERTVTAVVHTITVYLSLDFLYSNGLWTK